MQGRVLCAGIDSIQAVQRKDWVRLVRILMISISLWPLKQPAKGISAPWLAASKHNCKSTLAAAAFSLLSSICFSCSMCWQSTNKLLVRVFASRFSFFCGTGGPVLPMRETLPSVFVHCIVTYCNNGYTAQNSVRYTKLQAGNLDTS